MKVAKSTYCFLNSLQPNTYKVVRKVVTTDKTFTLVVYSIPRRKFEQCGDAMPESIYTRMR